MINIKKPLALAAFVALLILAGCETTETATVIPAPAFLSYAAETRSRWTSVCGKGIEIPCRSNSTFTRSVRSNWTGQSSPVLTHGRTASLTQLSASSRTAIIGAGSRSMRSSELTISLSVAFAFARSSP